MSRPRPRPPNPPAHICRRVLAALAHTYVHRHSHGGRNATRVTSHVQTTRGPPRAGVRKCSTRSLPRTDHMGTPGHRTTRRSPRSTITDSHTGWAGPQALDLDSRRTSLCKSRVEESTPDDLARRVAEEHTHTLRHPCSPHVGAKRARHPAPLPLICRRLRAVLQRAASPQRGFAWSGCTSNDVAYRGFT